MIDSNIIKKIKQFKNSPWFIITIFSILGLIGILNHSMWRDEMNTWLILRDSESFFDIINNINYQGHPLLWGVSLTIVRSMFQWLIDTPLIMQIFHLCLAISCMIVFWFYSPFTYRQKLLFSFGYFPFYEYSIIARPYAFGTLFIFLFCATFETRKKTYLFLTLWLGLMANSNAYALFVSVALTFMLFLEFCFDHNHRKAYFKNSKNYDFYLSLLILISLYLLAIYIIMPPPDSANHGGLTGGWTQGLDLRHLFRAIGRLFGSYLMIIPNSKKWLDLIVCGLITLFMCGLTVFKLAKKPFPLAFYLTGNFIILSFTYFRFIGGGHRHLGYFYLVLIAALWLGELYKNSNILVDKISLSDKLLKVFHKWHYYVFIIILYFNLLGGIYGYVRDIAVPYSASKATANYMIKNNLTDEFIVGTRDAHMAALSGYINRRFYYPELQQMGSFTLFKEPRKEVDHPEILRQLNVLLESKSDLSKILLVSHETIEMSEFNLQLTPIDKFEKAFIDNEVFYLYWVEKKDY